MSSEVFLRDNRKLHLEGELKFSEAAALWKSLSLQLTSIGRGEKLDFDMSRVQRVDGATMALLVHLRNELKLRASVRISSAQPARCRISFTSITATKNQSGEGVADPEARWSS